MLSIIVETFIVIILCVDKRRNLYCSFYLMVLSEQLRRTPAGSSQLVTPPNLPTFVADFEPSSLASHPSFRKHARMTLSMIVACGVEVIESTPLCDLSLDLCKIMECSNISLTSSSSTCFSSFFLSHLDVIIVRTVDEKLQWLDQRFKMFVQHDILLDSTGLQSAM